MSMNIDPEILRAIPHERIFETSQPCEVHFRHVPISHQNHGHHVWPTGMGGPDIPENIVVVCPTGHYNIHLLLKSWVKADGDPGRAITKLYSRGERKYAELGFKRWKAKDMLLPKLS